MDMPPQFNKDKEEPAHHVSYEQVAADVQAAGIRGETYDINQEFAFDEHSTKYEGEKDPLTRAERQTVANYAKSLRRGLSVETSADGDEWQPYWDYCRLANKDPKKALEIAQENPLSNR